MANNNTISQLEINGITYDILDANTRDAVSNKVSKSGDTITGEIVNTGDSRVYNIKGINTNLALANNGVSATKYPGYQVLDSQNRISMRLEGIIGSSGNNGWNLYAKNYNTSGEATGQKGITCTLNKSGTATWTVGDPANFRSAIGAQWKVQQHTATSATSIAKDDSKEITLNITPPSGWTPVGVIGFSTGNRYCSPSSVDLNNNTLTWYVKNNWSSTQNVTPWARVLYIKHPAS